MREYIAAVIVTVVIIAFYFCFIKPVGRFAIDTEVTSPALQNIRRQAELEKQYKNVLNRQFHVTANVIRSDQQYTSDEAAFDQSALDNPLIGRALSFVRYNNAFAAKTIAMDGTSRMTPVKLLPKVANNNNSYDMEIATGGFINIEMDRSATIMREYDVDGKLIGRFKLTPV